MVCLPHHQPISPLIWTNDSQVPVLDDVRDITLVEAHKHELVALISYEDMAPPQLWKLEILKDRENGRESSRLALR